MCNGVLPAIGEDGNEEAREAHVQECLENRISQISAHHRQTRSPPPPRPTEPERPSEPEASPVVPMVRFKATEKDCVGADGATQECTICMEEYEIGQSLVRLECFCKYHKDCLVDWFGVAPKRECPVHKIN